MRDEKFMLEQYAREKKDLVLFPLPGDEAIRGRIVYVRGDDFLFLSRDRRRSQWGNLKNDSIRPWDEVKHWNRFTNRNDFHFIVGPNVGAFMDWTDWVA